MRRLKPHKLDSVSFYDTGKCLDLFVDRETMEFFFEQHGVRTTSKTFEDLKKLAFKAVRSPDVLTWRPFIEVAVEQGEQRYSSEKTSSGSMKCHIDLGFERFESAVLPDGQHRARPHILDQTKGVDYDSSRNWAYHSISNPALRPECVPYDQVTWDALVAIRSIILTAGAKIETITSGNNIKRLGTVFDKKLGAALLLPLRKA